ncbi:MOSC domain-containing protein [Noviherbaspirillum cavernae]|uniref:MOSC domain-containing protein n=1 Tax=Noviherbaspirillum cavernae TaxID=2320862 RepID=A0A418WY09_9BURK|nr:MOSC N-terminal beta barrel domain-containing protein [Noviherbaspirillum cavernae]RJG04975.1 MOSC domain-containing protein [Noviherbaspirillum cavernae]
MPILTELNLYPVKSCGGIALREATLTQAGLMSEHIYDREWMVVDARGEFLTQRDHPRMALIKPRIKADTLELRAPGMLGLEIPLDLPDPDQAPTRDVRVWNDTLKAYDCDETTAVWFSNFLGTPCRLVRFHPHAQRSANKKWTNAVEAPTLFSDGYPMLVISEASLADLNDKLVAQGRATLPMSRFRPNIVINGIDAFEEDYAESFKLGDASLKPVKPCPRCPIPSIDQATGVIGPDPLDILRTYRVNPKVDGGITFGMNAILLEGEGQVLRVGQEVEVTLVF